jgi:hypothetical protein
MKIKMTAQEFEYLSKADFLPTEIYSLISKNTLKPGLILDIGDQNTRPLHNLLSHRLLEVGYDINDKLTAEGRILDSLIDKMPRIPSTEEIKSYDLRKQEIKALFIICDSGNGIACPLTIKTPQGSPFLAVASPKLVDVFAKGKNLEGRLRALTLKDLVTAGHLLKYPLGVVLLSIEHDVDMLLKNPVYFPYKSFTRILTESEVQGL